MSHQSATLKRISERSQHGGLPMSKDSELLVRCSDLRNRLVQPRPGLQSRAFLDLSEFDGNPGYPDAAERVVVCFDYWTVVTADQLRGISVVIESGASGYSIFPIMRAVIEHSAWICWILDESCSALQRIARANLAFLNTGAMRTQAASFLNGRKSSAFQSERAEYRRLRDEIRATFGAVTFDPISIDGETLPTPTEVVEHMGKVMSNERLWTGVYHYLCGMANHPSLSVMEMIGPSTSGNHAIQISAERMEQSVRATIGPYLQSLHYMCAYMGWQTSELDLMYDEIVDE